MLVGELQCDAITSRVARNSKGADIPPSGAPQSGGVPDALDWWAGGRRRPRAPYSDKDDYHGHIEG